MDVLTDWVQMLKTHVVILARSEMPKPWGFRMVNENKVVFHIILKGDGWLRREGAEPLYLQEGDLVMLAQGETHELVDEPQGEARPIEVVLAEACDGPCEGPFTTLLCGSYCFDVSLMQPFLRTLPPVVHFSAAHIHPTTALGQILGLITCELDQTQPGSDVLTQHLFDALFIYVVRAWLENGPTTQPSWLTALKDPALAKALSQMHVEPQRAWTVESLAVESGLSRAAFARRFNDHVGEPPLTYLTRWRMGLASRMLTESETSLADVATQIGYTSEFTFSRAFKRMYGMAPSFYRRQTS